MSTIAFSQDVVALAERTIRDQAAKVVSHANTRVHHPSFGYTKTSIRAEMAKLEGMCGLYMVLVGQANHASVGSLADFSDPKTEEAVTAARRAVRDL